MKVKSCVFVALASLAAFADPNDPQVALVSAGQDLDRVVTVKYTLDGSAIVTFDVLTNGVSIGAENLKTASGDVWRVVAATGAGEVRTIAWNAYESWPDHKFKNGEVSVKVTAWATNSPPDYMVIKLVGDDKGARTFYTAPEQLPGEGGVTNDMYKTDYLVMRRIPAAGKTFRMGSPSSEFGHNVVGKEILHYVSLTNDFYMGVFELTQGQYKNVIGSEPATYGTYGAKYPCNRVTFNTFRGTGKLWPADGHEIDAGCYLDTFRSVLGIPSLDLPTEAEWEFACRAGTLTPRYDGAETVSGVAPELAWTDGAGPGSSANHDVGLLIPNAWGLYDMYGNVDETCLDWFGDGDTYAVYGEMQIAPVGPPQYTTSTQTRVIRGTGTCWSNNAKQVRSAFRQSYDGLGSHWMKVGYRLTCTF